MNTLETLREMEVEIASMEETSRSAADAIALAKTDAEGLPLGVRSSLAQLHGTANSLLATRLDAITTSELTSGKDETRALRKALVARAESLIESLEAHIKAIDALKASASASGTAAMGAIDASSVKVESVETG